MYYIDKESCHRRSDESVVCVNLYLIYKAFRHVKTLFVQGNKVRTDKKKPFLAIKKVCYHQYKLDYLGRIKFLHVKMPH